MPEKHLLVKLTLFHTTGVGLIAVIGNARVVVEHTISRVKKFNIFGQEFRNRLRHYEAMTDIVCGLVNARIAGSW
jgi:hypothetical protein